MLAYADVIHSTTITSSFESNPVWLSQSNKYRPSAKCEPRSNNNNHPMRTRVAPTGDCGYYLFAYGTQTLTRALSRHVSWGWERINPKTQQGEELFALCALFWVEKVYHFHWKNRRTVQPLSRKAGKYTRSACYGVYCLASVNQQGRPSEGIKNNHPPLWHLFSREIYGHR